MIEPQIGMPQGMEWLVILTIFVLLFGATKLPALARSTGQALRIFKSETKTLREDETSKPAGRTVATGEILTHDDVADDVVRERRNDSA